MSQIWDFGPQVSPNASLTNVMLNLQIYRNMGLAAPIFGNHALLFFNTPNDAHITT